MAKSLYKKKKTIIFTNLLFGFSENVYLETRFQKIAFQDPTTPLFCKMTVKTHTISYNYKNYNILVENCVVQMD